MRCALTQRLSSESSEAIMGPMSSGWPTRPSAVISATRLLISGLSRPVLSQKALVHGAAIEQPTMAATLVRMERDGLVERRAHRTDARTSLFRLTRLAKSKLPQFFKQLKEGNAAALAGLSAQERNQLLYILGKVIRNFGGKLPDRSLLRA